MKRQLVDYRGFRLSRITEPEFSHLLLLLGWVGYFILYFLTENLIPAENCHVVHSRLDDIIPFCEYFVIAYVFWYLFIVSALLRYALTDVGSFRKLQIFIIITQIVAMAAYIAWPSVQHLRPEVFPRDNVFSRVLGAIYSFDTPTGVCPSLHVAYSIGIASVCCKEKTASKLRKILTVLAAVIISISTAFVKQHSVLDIFWALPLGLLAEIIVYGRSYWLPRFRGKKGTS